MFDALTGERQELLLLYHDARSGYRGVLAIHDTTLGPALGGTQWERYADEPDAAVHAQRRARAMTYRAAAAGLQLGGGSAVMLRGPMAQDPAALLAVHGRLIEWLGGRLITSADAGTTVEDMRQVRRATSHVIGLRSRGGEAARLTALGVFRGIQAAVAVVLRRSDLAGLTVAVEGLGDIGYALCRLLNEWGAELYVSDADTRQRERAADELGAHPVPAGGIRGLEMDVFAPCARGGVVSARTVGGFRCRIVAGAANDQLAREADGDELARRGVVYLPDYFIDVGGAYAAASELFGWPEEEAERRTREIHGRVLDLLNAASRAGLPPHRITNRRVQARLRGARRRRKEAA